MEKERVLYSKYRPSNLDEVIGQKTTVATLKMASKANRFANSYLLSGERGCGKTSTARILAKLMGCENVENGITCGKCDPCLSIDSDLCMDVKELNGAKNGKVEDINALIDSAYRSPQELSRKIYIIDECHQLTKEAESNLLKIVEEPPRYLTFIFCTTEVDKIKDTILSRCQKFNFGKILSEDIAKRLQYIAGEERIVIEENALLSIARLARGSMRDAIGYLDQIATVAGNKKITEKHINIYFAVPDRQAVLNIIKSMLNGDIALMIDQVNDMVTTSIRLEDILFEIAETLRNIQTAKIPNVNQKLIDLPENEVNELKKLAECFEITKLIKLAHVFSDIGKKVTYHINPRWIMEATLINCSISLSNKK